MIDHQVEMKEILRRATDEINKGNGAGQQRRGLPGPGPDLGEEYAVRFREAAARTATAIEDQAQERMQVALAQVEEAKTHIERAKKIADEIRAGGENEAERALATARRLKESDELLHNIRRKFETDELPATTTTE
jgi:hypothetical protein